MNTQNKIKMHNGLTIAAGLSAILAATLGILLAKDGMPALLRSSSSKAPLLSSQ